MDHQVLELACVGITHHQKIVFTKVGLAHRFYRLDRVFGCFWYYTVFQYYLFTDYITKHTHTHTLR